MPKNSQRPAPYKPRMASRFALIIGNKPVRGAFEHNNFRRMIFGGHSGWMKNAAFAAMSKPAPKH